jgi:2-keto-4-pentenoate hydratase/2-oxohepta-3-ene-1,7-dioic acid hydratase in catechol pathway
MRIVRYRAADGPAWGAVDAGDRVRAAGDMPFADAELGPEVGSLADLELLAPAAPSKVICVGWNYRKHVAEFDNPLPDEPVLFMKPPSSIIGPGAEVHYPALSRRVDPEAELVLVIGREAHRVPAERSMDVIGGYTCGNDVTARDIQRSDGQWTRGKGFDTFCPIGPWIETELDPSDLRVTCSVDGELRQDGRTGDLIFPIPYLIEHISRFTRLLPGDLVMTGTPDGVGPMEVGQTVVVEVEGIGRLENRLVDEPDAEDER